MIACHPVYVPNPPETAGRMASAKRLREPDAPGLCVTLGRRSAARRKSAMTT
jgi:hypothetical protein